jgi:2-succinyl-5-enolpyruvyl-6-hydroxy-3-cyclohexene-1-carboxylate synthase
MTSNKKSTALLADLFVKHGLEDILISPGSRNAPIILAFAGHPAIKAMSIVDERSAAFYALGMAQEKGKAVALACTSGTATLNYAPAIAEAFYQKIPMLILTADRPEEYIDIGDGQCIRQKDVYRNYVKASFEIKESLDTPSSFDLAVKIINRAIQTAHYPEPGPVHLNLPFHEPLYEATNNKIEGELIQVKSPNPISNQFLKTLADRWNRYERVMLIAGQQEKNEQLNTLLKTVTEHKNAVLLTETTSNLYGENFIGCIDNVMAATDQTEAKIFQPDLLITFGGHIVSKKIKKFLRENKPKEHWHLNLSGKGLNTFFALTESIQADPVDFFERIIPYLKRATPVFAGAWLRKKDRVINRRERFLNNTEYSDLKVFEMLLDHIPTGTTLHLGNSTPVRYSQLFGSKEWIRYRSNRGVSGIDGQISTAAGAARVSDHLHILITGDLGFFYDLNGLDHLPANLKIILINNGGGGIFRFIPGPDTSPYLERFFEAKHQKSARKFVEAFGLKYYQAQSVSEILFALPEFFNNREEACVLEIFTPREKNAVVLREYFKFLAK